MFILLRFFFVLYSRQKKKGIIKKLTFSFFSCFISLVLSPFFIYMSQKISMCSNTCWGGSGSWAIPCECLDWHPSTTVCIFLLLLIAPLCLAWEGWPQWAIFMPTTARPRNLGLWAVVSLPQPRGTENRIFVLPLQMANRLECASNLRRGQAHFNYKLLRHFKFVISLYL